MSDRINQILQVLEFIFNNYKFGLEVTDISKLRASADNTVAESNGIKRRTVQDKYRRQLQPLSLGTLPFDQLVHEWLAQGSITLYEILIQRSVDTDDKEKVLEFFEHKFSTTSLLTPIALDITEPAGVQRSKIETYRVLRDTALARHIKILHQNKCQVCGSTINLFDGKSYSEAHHIRPLGAPHNGPDIAANIVIVCPNHHVALDYGALPLDKNHLKWIPGHDVGDKYIDYHNSVVLKT